MTTWTEDSGYTVERRKHGMLVFGSVAIEELEAMSQAWKKMGWDLMHLGIAKATGAALAITNQEHGKLWVKEIEEKLKHDCGGDRELEWLNGTDTGTSSLTIFSVLSKTNAHLAQTRIGRTGAGVPWDPDDFGRCYRLLQRFPEWKVRMHEVAVKYPEWTGLVNHWGYLWALWEEESPSGSAPRLYETMKACIEESRAR